MIFVNTDISTTPLSEETIALRTEIEDYLLICNVPHIAKLRDYLERINHIYDDKSRLALETWFLNKPEVAGIGLPSYIGC
jgi:hypothetical protein